MRAMGDSGAERILRVAERLFAERGFRDVTVRDIAHGAGVTHPLIYYYWGSKRGVLAAVLERTQARMRSMAVGRGGASETVLALVRDNLSGGRLYLRIMARAFLGGMSPGDWPGGFPTVERMLDLFVDGEPTSRPEAEVREIIAAAIALAVGWILLEDQLLEVVGLTPADLEEARETLLRSFAAVIGPLLPPD